MGQPIRALILEDRAADARLVVRELTRAGFEPDWQRVESEAEFLRHLEPAPDVIIADYALPQFDALRALRLLQARGLDTPFIVVSGSIGEELATALLREGASDYLLKDRLGRLGRAVVSAIEDRSLRERHRQALASLELGTARLNLALNGADLGTWDWDLRSGRIAYDQRFAEISGYSLEQLDIDEEAWRTLTWEPDTERARAAFLAHASGDTPVFECEHRIRHRSGEPIWVMVRGRIIERTTDGGPLRACGTMLDISESRRMHRRLQQSNDLLELVRQAQNRFLTNPDRKAGFEVLLEGLLRVTESEYGFIGETRQDESGNPYLKINAMTNIAWDEATRALYGEWMQQGGAEFRNLDTLFGAVLRTAEPVIANHPASDPRAAGRPAGHPPLDTFLGLPIIDSGKLVGMAGVANRRSGYDGEMVEFLQPFLSTCAQLFVAHGNLEARRRAEEELAAERQFLDQLIESAPEGIAVLSADERVLRVNREFTHLFDIEAADAIGRDINALIVPPALVDEASRLCRRLLEGGESFNVETVRRRRDGSTFDVSILGTPLRVPGRETRALVIYRDISARKHAVNALAESESRFRTLANSGTALVWTCDAGGRINYVNGVFERFCGRPAVQLLSNGWTELCHPLDRARRDAAFALALSRQASFTDEFRLLRADGEYRWITQVASPRLGIRGEFIGYIGQCLDVSDTREAEAALRESALFTRATLDSLPEALAVFDADGRVLTTNARWNALSADYGEHGAPTRVGEDFIAYCDRCVAAGIAVAGDIALGMRAMIAGRSASLEFEFPAHLPGGRRWFNIRGVRFRGEGPVRLILTLEDTTGRVQAETQLREALHEKETLLKEVHHRVKNNLQIVSSLLSMQSEDGDVAAASSLRESIDRVRSMALIHEQLYESRSLACIEFGAYAQSLATYLFNSHAPHPGIALLVDVEAVELNIETAVPLGLILNELVSNAFKHGFRNCPDRGTLTVSLRRDGEATWTLTVADDGVGLPAGFSLGQAASMGLSLVRSLARQLKATLAVDTGAGTAFSVSFRELRYAKR